MRRLVYAHEARKASTWLVACALALALILPAAGLAFGDSRATAFAIIGIAALAFAIAIGTAIVVGGVVPRRVYGDDAELARWIGPRAPEVASDLLSSVELARATERNGAPSPELVEALVASTEHRLGKLEPAALIPRRELAVARRSALALAVVHVVVLAVARPTIARGWRELLFAAPSPFGGAQVSAVPLVGDLDVTLTFPAYTKRPPAILQSSSGDIRGLPGTHVALTARVLVPQVTKVEIVVESQTGVTEKTIEARYDHQRITAELTIEHSARYRFAVIGADDARAVEATPRTIDAEPDLAPVVQLVVPSEPLDVSNLRRVELAYVIEDDFGLVSAELVWESGKDRGKKPIVITPGLRAQNKLLWDIAEVQPIPSGGDVRYWIEAKDNHVGVPNPADPAAAGPNIGKSREYHLKVVSPRERHEETLGRQQELAERLVKNLGGRLVLGDDQAPRDELAKGLREGITMLGTIGAAYDKDPHASEALRKSLAAMRDRLDKLAVIEQKLFPKQHSGATRGTFAGIDPKMIAELEDDAIALADWLDRERLEGLLDLSDEIAAHQKRLHDLLAEYARTKDPRVLDEIEREMRALDRSYAELEKHRQGMAEDVLDQYVHKDAVQAQAGTSCVDEVRKLVRAGKPAEAQQKLEQCQQEHDRGAASLEGSLAQLRGDKFSDEQKKLDEVMNELADVAKDQDDIAAESNRIFEQYAEKADEVAREHRKEASKKVTALVDKLRKRIAGINENGLTPFAKEELDIVTRRLDDVEHMVGEGDLAEALGMATQAKTSLDTIAGELEAALNDDPKSKWADATQDALDGIEKSRPIAKELIDLLQSLSPRPDQIMSADDQKSLERLKRREAMTKDRAKRLADKTKQLGGELPGDAGAELGKRLGSAIDQMGMANDRMGARDPSGARESTRAAADALAKARDRARSAARQAQEGAVGDEPIKIPGADEYRAPERYREDLMEAMKKKGQAGPDGYDDMIKRYYEELVK